MNLVNLYYTNVQDWDIDFLKRSLSNDELEKIQQIRHPLTLKQKIVNRALLKSLLMNHYGIKQEDLIFSYNERGKPMLRSHPSLYFNASHANEIVLIGISTSGLIGVDIEWVQKDLDEDAIAKSFFSTDEYCAYIQYKVSHRKAFYHFWTAKEAVIKALGKGLWEGKDVPQIAIEDHQLTLKHQNKVAIENWSITFPVIHKEYVACLAMNQAVITLNTQYMSCLMI